MTFPNSPVFSTSSIETNCKSFSPSRRAQSANSKTVSYIVGNCVAQGSSWVYDRQIFSHELGSSSNPSILCRKKKMEVWESRYINAIICWFYLILLHWIWVLCFPSQFCLSWKFYSFSAFSFKFLTKLLKCNKTILK